MAKASRAITVGDEEEEENQEEEGRSRGRERERGGKNEEKKEEEEKGQRKVVFMLGYHPNIRHVEGKGRREESGKMRRSRKEYLRGEWLGHLRIGKEKIHTLWGE